MEAESLLRHVFMCVFVREFKTTLHSLISDPNLCQFGRQLQTPTAGT